MNEEETGFYNRKNDCLLVVLPDGSTAFIYCHPFEAHKEEYRQKFAEMRAEERKKPEI